MNNFFKQDKPIVGVVLGLGTEIATALVVGLIIVIFGLKSDNMLHWFAACFIPPILVLRYLIKAKNQLSAIKSLIITLFATFVLYMLFIF